MSEHAIALTADIPADLAGARLDKALAMVFPEHSRARLQGWIQDGVCLVDGKPSISRYKTRGGEHIEILARVPVHAPEWQPEPMPLEVIFADSMLIVINKPAGCVVHPAAGNPNGTLVNGLLHHFPELAHLPRAGIVHRLDKDTTGLMVVARTLSAHSYLVQQIMQHQVQRVYQAVVRGNFVAGGTVAAPIGRHPRDRKKMAVIASGKPARTHYRILEKFSHYCHLQCQLETGRTHQIRVHMAHLKHPLVGDPTYAGQRPQPQAVSPTLQQAIAQFKRQALHASELSLVHPDSGQTLSWRAPLPHDMAQLLEALRAGG